jgi:outer membrane protein
VPVFTPQQNFTFSKIPYSDQLNNNFNSSVYLSLHVPILNGFLAKNKVRLAKITLRTNELVAQNTRVQLQQSVEQAYQNMIASYNRYQASIEQVAAYAASFKAAEARFNEGASTSVDYVIAKNNIDRANTSLSSNKYDYIFRTKILDFYQNKLLW